MTLDDFLESLRGCVKADITAQIFRYDAVSSGVQPHPVSAKKADRLWEKLRTDLIYAIKTGEVDKWIQD